VHGTVLSLGDLEGLAQRLRSVGKAERGRLLGEPARADLILPGWAIVTAILERLGIDRIEANIFGPRLGILTESGGAIIANRLGEVE
jgi:exopolyphosphatase/pppGpp-phosphohydrolase